MSSAAANETKAKIEARRHLDGQMVVRILSWSIDDPRPPPILSTYVIVLQTLAFPGVMPSRHEPCTGEVHHYRSGGRPHAPGHAKSTLISLPEPVSRLGRAPSAALFFLERLLAARHGSWFPTNTDGDDEEVNVYLACTLEKFVKREHQPELKRGAWATLQVPSANLTAAGRAQYYRANGDDRLLHLGLFDRGDGQRRRAVPVGITAADSRLRDVLIMRSCYATAADLLARAPGPHAGLAPVLRRLAEHGEDYVHVLQVLAKRHLGLGTRLADGELANLLTITEDECDDADESNAAVDALLQPRADQGVMDVVLDLVSEYRRRPTAALWQRVANLAAPLGLDVTRLTGAGATP